MTKKEENNIKKRYPFAYKILADQSKGGLTKQVQAKAEKHLREYFTAASIALRNMFIPKKDIVENEGMIYLECVGETPLTDELIRTLKEIESFSFKGVRIPLQFLVLEEVTSSEQFKKVEEKYNSLKSKYEDISNGFSSICQKSSELESQIFKYKDELSTKEKEIEGRKSSYSKLKKENFSLLKDKGKVIQENLELKHSFGLDRCLGEQGLEFLLTVPEERFIDRQRNIILEEFSKVSKNLRNIEYKGKISKDQLEKDKKHIDNKEKVGSVLENLPEEAIRLTQDIWRISEEHLKQYFKDSLDVDIPLLYFRESGIFMFPLTEENSISGGLSSEIYNLFFKFTEYLKGKKKLVNISSLKMDQYIALKFEEGGMAGDNIQSEINEYFNCNLPFGVKKISVNVIPLGLNYFSHYDLETLEKKEEINIISKKDFIVKRIRELGYKSIEQFKKEKKISGLNSLWSQSPHCKFNASEEYKRKIADALEFDFSEVNKVL